MLSTPSPATDPSTNTAARRSALAEILRMRGLDAALVTKLVNVRYLTGLVSSNAAVLVRADGHAVLATDGRYVTQASEQAPDVELRTARGVAKDLIALARTQGLGAVALEEHDVTLELSRTLAGALGGPPADLHQAVEELRTVKDESELAALRAACAISCAALEDLLDAPLLGRSERDIARDLETRMYAGGAEALAFETIVATGPHSAIPHHSPTDRRVARGDFLKIDFGARVDGYHADCTRTVVVGAEPADWQREIYDVVRAAQRAGRHALAPGVECTAVDEAARSVVRAAGHGEHFTHGLGHGVGLEIHEAPLLGYSAAGRLADRTSVTVEPGIYLPGRGGVRIEDTLVVRDAAGDEIGDGGPELLTTTTKDLLVCAG